MIDQSEQIKKFLLSNIEAHPADIVSFAAEHFTVTRTTIHRHLTKLLNDKLLLKSGTTRDVNYFLASSVKRSFTYKISPDLEEFEVFNSDFKDIFGQCSESINDICHYGFTEIFNNAIDHSYGQKIIASTNLSDHKLIISIEDDGVGVFKTIYDYFHLDDMRESILQLNKGKMTTDPADHTGEGIFFSSRVFDEFEIYANGLHYLRNNIENDWAVESASTTGYGSKIIMQIDLNSAKDIVAVFKQYQDPESLEFDRTEIVVELSRVGDERLISRSQAKRILRRLDKFHIVVLDFSRIRLVGQGFVDEVFRVYANRHPTMRFKYINANDDVIFMIERGIATAKKERGQV